MKRNTTKKFDAKTGMRLTTCCAAHSTYMDDGIGGEVLCCKACYHEVEVGEGDGCEYEAYKAKIITFLPPNEYKNQS